MTNRGKFEAALLFIGDLLCLVAGLWLTLLVRYQSLPSGRLFLDHLSVFGMVFGLWLIVFFIFDLYRRRTLIFSSSLPAIILRAQLINSLVAVLFFYFFGNLTAGTITPKTNLFINLPISFLLIWGWRIYIFDRWALGKKLTVSFVCTGPEVEELKSAITKQARYRLALTDNNPALIVFDKYDTPAELEQNFGRWLFRGVRFVTVQELYEEIFERVPLSLLDDRWFLEESGHYPKALYDFGKRVMDIVLGLCLGLLTLPIYPFVWLALKWEDGGPIFFRQARVGKNQKLFQILKFRSMRDEKVTRVGQWLRRSRLDELPQLWSVVAGEQSLIGPRPEKPDYAAEYRRQIAYYDLRHLLSPGLSGWAQLYQENHPHHRPETELTREKLSYDLYYLKHRGLWLDIKIALKTLKTVLSRTGI